MLTMSTTTTFLNAGKIPYVSDDEANQLMQTELTRFLALIETLEPDDWGKPTACSEWDVQDILAHQAGGYASGASFIEMIRQAIQKPEPGKLKEDAINAFQLQERAGKTPQELIEELREVGPVGAHKWAYGYKLMKLISMPHRDIGKLSFRHLMLVIHSRDTWMHRLDICRATGREFEQTSDHDPRIVELIVLDVADQLRQKYSGPVLEFDLTGIAGGRWQTGQGEPAATIRMDALEFSIFASGRYRYPEARPMMSIDGDITSAEEALKQILVLF